MDYLIKTPCILEPSRREDIRAKDPGGFLDKLNVAEGQRVKKGEVIAVLTNIDLEREVAEIGTQIAMLQKQLIEAMGRGDQNEVSQIKLTIEQYHKEAAHKRAQLDGLTLSAPFNGTVMIPEESKTQEQTDKDILTRKKGTRVMSGDKLPICKIGDTDKVIVHAVVLDYNIGDVAPPDESTPGARVTLRTYAYPNRAFEGTVLKKTQSYQEYIKNLALLSPFGGEVALKQSGEPMDHYFVVDVSIDNSDGLLKPGMTGYAKIHAGRKTLGQRFLGFLKQKIRVMFRM
jgi:hypothetical protein